MCDGPSPTPRVRARLTYKVVPRWTSESDFWRLYFSQATPSQHPPPQRDPHACTCAAGSIHPRKCAHVRHVPASSAAAAAAERGASGSGAGVRAAAGARGAAALRPGGGVERVLCGAVMHTLETGRLWGEPWAYCIFCQCIMSCWSWCCRAYAVGRRRLYDVSDSSDATAEPEAKPATPIISSLHLHSLR